MSGRHLTFSRTSFFAHLEMRGEPNSDQNESKGSEQTSRRDAVDAGADDCRCFVHGATFLKDVPSVRWPAIRRSQSTIFRAGVNRDRFSGCITRPTIPLPTMQRASPHASPFAGRQNVPAADPLGQLATMAAFESSFPRHQDESPNVVETFENTFAAWRFSVQPDRFKVSTT